LARANAVGSFEYQGAYESRGALSLAQRSAYGIRERCVAHSRNVSPPTPVQSTPQVSPATTCAASASRPPERKLTLPARTGARLPVFAARAPAWQTSVTAGRIRLAPAAARAAGRQAKLVRCAVRLGDAQLTCVAWGSRVLLALRKSRKD